jgi:diguanylate cyclase (GGDEF)-like protein
MERVVDIFLTVAADEHGSQRLESEPWGSIHFRMINADGEVIPLEVTGTGGLDDPVVQGLVYELQPAWAEELLRQVLTGLASGAPTEELLRLVVRTVTIPPLEVEAVLVDCTDRNRHVVLVEHGATLASVIAGLADPTPWTLPAESPVRVLVGDVEGPLGDQLAQRGFTALWHVAVGDMTGRLAYRIVAATPSTQQVANATAERMDRARDLVAVVLQRARTDDMLAHAATHDALTELPNRAGFYAALEAAAAGTDPVGLLYLDLDGFKPVNDRYGHARGDDVLRRTATRLRSIIRPPDVVARLGGDEFAVLVRQTVAGADALTAIAHRIEAALREPHRDGGPSVTVGASVGAVTSSAPFDPDELMRLADEAMYAKKRDRTPSR